MNIDYYTLCVFSILLPIHSCSSISSCQFNEEVLSCKIWSNLYIDTYILCLWVLVNFEIGVFLNDSTRSLIITQERMYGRRRRAVPNRQSERKGSAEVPVKDGLSLRRG